MMPEVFYLILTTLYIFAAILLFTYFLYRYFINKMERQRKENLQSIIIAQENERSSIAREVHDSLGPLLSITNMQLEALINEPDTETISAGARDIQTQLKQVILMCRDISHALSPFGSTSQRLEEIVNDYIYKVKNAGRVNIHFTHDIKNLKINEQKSASIYRVLLELVNNTLTHANATQIKIDMKQKDGCFNMTYFDNGVGMQIADMKKGLGIRNIMSRIQLLKGQVYYHPYKAGKGITVQISIPAVELR